MITWRWVIGPGATIIFLVPGPVGYLPVLMIVLPSDPMGIRHERHNDTKRFSQSRSKVQAERCAHITIFANIWSCRVPFLGQTLHLSHCALRILDMTTHCNISALTRQILALGAINTYYCYESAWRYHTQGPDLYALPQAKGALKLRAHGGYRSLSLVLEQMPV